MNVIWQSPETLNRYAGPPVSLYDANHLPDIIITGEGDWLDAYLFRFLYVALKKADSQYLPRLIKAFPNHCRVMFVYFGWSEDSIRDRFNQYGVI